PGQAGLRIQIEIVQRPATTRLGRRLQNDFRIGPVVQIDDIGLTGQTRIKLQEAVAIMEHAERAVIDQYWPWRKTRADLLHVLAITGVEVPVLELLNLLQRRKFLQALLQRHHADLLYACSL